MVRVRLQSARLQSAQDDLDGVDGGHDQINGVRCGRERAVAEPAQQGFGGVGHRLQPGQAHKARRALERMKETKDASQSGLVARISLEQDQGLVYLIQALVRLDDEVAQNVIHARRPCLGPLASEADQAARTVARNFSTSVWRRSACSPRC